MPLTALLLLSNLPMPAFAWGGEGHDIVAQIALKLLTPQAKAKVNGILGNETMMSVAIWADTIRGEQAGKRPETPHWHFVDTPLGSGYDKSRDCAETPNGSCVISALVMFQDILSGKKKGYHSEKFNRYEALKFIIHFSGDLHQPLHCITDTRGNPDGDQGGNLKKVTWFGTTGKKLHGIWDTDILRRNMVAQNNANSTAYADFLFNSLTQQERNAANPSTSSSPTVVSRQKIEDWAKATHEIAEGAYGNLGNPDSSGVYLLGAPYYDSHKAEVDKQLKLAGVRLAKILNETLR